MDSITIPKSFIQDDLVIIARREYERLLRLRDTRPDQAHGSVTEDDVLQWSKQAREMKARA